MLHKLTQVCLLSYIATMPCASPHIASLTYHTFNSNSGPSTTDNIVKLLMTRGYAKVQAKFKIRYSRDRDFYVHLVERPRSFGPAYTYFPWTWEISLFSSSKKTRSAPERGDDDVILPAVPFTPHSHLNS